MNSYKKTIPFKTRLRISLLPLLRKAINDETHRGSVRYFLKNQEQVHQLMNKTSQAQLKSRFLSECKRVPLYQNEPFNTHLAQSIKTNQLLDFPYSTKNFLNKFKVELINPLFQKQALAIAYSNGSTGKPFRLTRSPLSQISNSYFLKKAFQQYLPDFELPSVIPFINHSNPHVLALVGKKGAYGKRGYYCFLNPIDRQLVEMRAYNFHTIDLTRAKELAKSLEELNPTVLTSTPLALNEWIHLLRKNKITCTLNNLRLIFCSGDHLSDELRNRIEDFFKVPVQNGYASVEGGVIAADCPHRNGFHLLSSINELEILKSDQTVTTEGEGELLLTSLLSGAFPLIRYNTEDRVEFISNFECACGYRGGHIKSLNGRLLNYFVSHKGNRYNPVLCPGLLADVDFEQYQLIQTAVDEVTLKFMPPLSGEYESAFPLIQKRMEILLEGPVQMTFEKTNQFELVGGKAMATLCRIHNNERGPSQ